MTNQWFLRLPPRKGRQLFLKKVSGTICQFQKRCQAPFVSKFKKVSGTICQQTPAFGRGRVASGDRQMVPDTFFASVSPPATGKWCLTPFSQRQS
jgi:hypothetical protein